jgi:hypothetical protein
MDTDPTGTFVSTATHSSNPGNAPVYYPKPAPINYDTGGDSNPFNGLSGCNGFACYGGGQTIIKKHNAASGGHLSSGTSGGGTGHSNPKAVTLNNNNEGNTTSKDKGPSPQEIANARASLHQENHQGDLDNAVFDDVITLSMAIATTALDAEVPILLLADVVAIDIPAITQLVGDVIIANGGKLTKTFITIEQILNTLSAIVSTVKAVMFLGLGALGSGVLKNFALYVGEKVLPAIANGILSSGVALQAGRAIGRENQYLTDEQIDEEPGSVAVNQCHEHHLAVC